MASKRKSAEQKLREFLSKQNKNRCLNCSYYQNGYCNDLDSTVDPNYPICSETYYNS